MIERASATLAREQERPYTTLMNSAVEAIKQPDALAIYVYLQTKAERWIVRRADVMSRFGFGKDRYHKAMKHLREVGLVSNTQIRDKDSGTILDTQIVIHYEPKSVVTEVRSNQSPAEPDSGKQGHLTIDQSLEIKQDNKNGKIDSFLLEKITEHWNKYMAGISPKIDLTKNNEINKTRHRLIKKIISQDWKTEEYQTDYHDHEYWEGYIQRLAESPRYQWHREKGHLKFDQAFNFKKFTARLEEMRMDE